MSVFNVPSAYERDFLLMIDPPNQTDEEFCETHESYKCEKCNVFHCEVGDPCDEKNPYLRY